MKKIFDIIEDYDDIRIDKWIRKKISNVPQSLIEKSLRQGRIKVNNLIVKSSHKLKYKDKIYHLYQRLHGKNEYGGTGMGLAICKRIAEHHNGSITVNSTPGAGITFHVSLPQKQTPLSRGGKER